MSVLVGSVAGSSSRLAGGLTMSAGLMVSDVQPTTLQVIRPSLGQNVGQAVGRFRRHLSGITTDATNSILGGVIVKWFDVATDLLVGSVTSDATSGVYDIPIYADGTYYAWIWKSGSPSVFGGSDRVTPV